VKGSDWPKHGISDGITAHPHGRRSPYFLLIAKTHPVADEGDDTSGLAHPDASICPSLREFGVQWNKTSLRRIWHVLAG
jgi:hypothetical protein